MSSRGGSNRPARPQPSRLSAEQHINDTTTTTVTLSFPSRGSINQSEVDPSVRRDLSVGMFWYRNNSSRHISSCQTKWTNELKKVGSFFRCIQQERCDCWNVLKRKQFHISYISLVRPKSCGVGLASTQCCWLLILSPGQHQPLWPFKLHLSLV